MYSFGRHSYNTLSLKTSTINLYVNPDAFHKNFNSSSITVCGLLLFDSPVDCGSPDIVPNSEIVYDNVNGVVKYRCHSGYKLIGSKEVRCGKYGQWMVCLPLFHIFHLLFFRFTQIQCIFRTKIFFVFIIGLNISRYDL